MFSSFSLITMPIPEVYCIGSVSNNLSDFRIDFWFFMLCINSLFVKSLTTSIGFHVHLNPELLEYHDTAKNWAVTLFSHQALHGREVCHIFKPTELAQIPQCSWGQIMLLLQPNKLIRLGPSFPLAIWRQTDLKSLLYDAVVPKTLENPKHAAFRSLNASQEIYRAEWLAQTPHNKWCHKADRFLVTNALCAPCWRQWSYMQSCVKTVW